MSEEEKKAIETLKGLTVYYDDYSLLDEEEIEENDNVNKSIQLIIDLVENQQKELNSLKEIEKSHKEENGKLRVELEQEKERNELLERHIENNYTSKDKIKEKIEDYEKMIKATFEDTTWYGQNRRDKCYEILRNLNELLEGK